MVWVKRVPCFILTVIKLLIFSTFCPGLAHNGKSVHFGRLVIGGDKTTKETKNVLVKEVHAGDTDGYQADQPQLTEGFQLAKSKFWRLSPSVQCNNDSMSLRVQGSRVPHFLLETSEKGSLPLSQMPSHCGLSVKRARRDVLLTANYDGCRVVQQGDSYSLPLRVWGLAVKMVCPVSRPPAIVSCGFSAMVVYVGVSPDAVRLKVYGVWQPVYQASTACGFDSQVVGNGLTLTAPYTSNCWKFEGAEISLSMRYMDGELILSCPAAVPLPANMQPGTSMDVPLTTTQATTTTVAPPTVGQWPYPFFPGIYPYGMPWPFYYSDPGAPPTTATTTATTTVPTTALTTTTQPTTGVPVYAQQQVYPWVSGLYPYGIPWHFLYRRPVSRRVTPTTMAPTTDTTVAPTIATTVAPAPVVQQHYPFFPGQYPYDIRWRFPYSNPGTILVAPTTPAPTTPAPTTVTMAVPTNAVQQIYPWYSGLYNPYGASWQFQYITPSPITSTTPLPITPAPSSSSDERYLVTGIYVPYGLRNGVKQMPQNNFQLPVFGIKRFSGV